MLEDLRTLIENAFTVMRHVLLFVHVSCETMVGNDCGACDRWRLLLDWWRLGLRISAVRFFC